MSPRVSVIIPLYNKAAHVLNALDSVASQTFADMEVIIVNDGSTDGGARLAADYPDARFRVVSQPNAGPGGARNRGIAEAKGELLAFLDADDEWLPEFLARSIKLLEEHGAATATSCYFQFPLGVSLARLWTERGIREGAYRLKPSTPPTLVVHMLAYMSPWSTVARADVVRRWGGFYDADRCLYAEDAFLWLKVLLNEVVAFSLEPLVRFNQGASELSANLKGARPVEPFLLHPEQVEACCPLQLRSLLEQVLAIRALKTACVLGYWGQWREARALKRRFAFAGSWQLPLYIPAQVCSMPLGAALGKAWRVFKRF
jgi:glycosyltransferase involved in cell wall biosynthesis